MLRRGRTLPHHWVRFLPGVQPTTRNFWGFRTARSCVCALELLAIGPNASKNWSREEYHHHSCAQLKPPRIAHASVGCWPRTSHDVDRKPQFVTRAPRRGFAHVITNACMHACCDASALTSKRNSCRFGSLANTKSNNNFTMTSFEHLDSLAEEFFRVASDASQISFRSRSKSILSGGLSPGGSQSGVPSPAAALSRQVSTGAPRPSAAMTRRVSMGLPGSASAPGQGASYVQQRGCYESSSRNSTFEVENSRIFEDCLGKFENEVRSDHYSMQSSGTEARILPKVANLEQADLHLSRQQAAAMI